MNQDDAEFEADMEVIISLCPVLSAEAERDLVLLHRAGAEPQATLALHRLELAAVRQVLGCAVEHRGDRLLSEAFAVGSVGWAAALLNFDPTGDARFSSYAAWWVRRALGSSPE